MSLYFLKIIIRKLRGILFFNSHNNIYNFLFISLIGIFSFKTLKWFIFNSRWTVVTSNLSLFAYGIFPENQQWRPLTWMICILIITAFTLSTYKWEFLKKFLILIWIGTVPLGIFLLYGGLGLTPALSGDIGGLTLSIFLTLSSLIFSLPLGVGLAFCRQSSLFIIRKLSSLYIDTMRSIPLIAVLFFGQLLIPLFLPLGLEIDRVWRAIFAFTFFVSAYIAEDIRGGLQSIPFSQIEAAKCLGLNKFQIIRLILIPQSLRLALPALTNQTIGLFQNTSLMSILGLVELLGIGRSILANPEFIGQYIEVYVWLACVYWLVCTMMALIARSLEKRLTIR